MDGPSQFGSFERLPWEVRQLVWENVDDNGLTRTSRAIRYEVFSCRDLTLGLSHIAYHVRCACKPGRYPTQVDVRDQHRQYPPLHPAFLEQGSPSPLRLRGFLAVPLSCYRSIKVKVHMPEGHHESVAFIRVYNSLYWCVSILTTQVESLREVSFEFVDDSTPRRVAQRSVPNQPPFDENSSEKVDLPPQHEGFMNDTDIWIVLKLLRRLRNIRQLEIRLAPSLQSCFGRNKIDRLVETVKTLSALNTPFGTRISEQDDPDSDWSILAESDLRASFYEMRLCGIKEAELLRIERHALWTDAYEKEAQRRLMNARHLDGSVPRFIERAITKFKQQRIVTRMYNPLGFTYRIVHLNWRHRRAYDQKFVGRQYLDKGKEYWSPQAWFHRPPLSSNVPKLPLYGRERFQRQLLRSYASIDWLSPPPWPSGVVGAQLPFS